MDRRSPLHPCYSGASSASASIARAENTSAAPALTAMATPSASAISSFVAPCFFAACTCRDAPVALARHAHRDGNQLPRLGIEMAGCRSSRTRAPDTLALCEGRPSPRSPVRPINACRYPFQSSIMSCPPARTIRDRVPARSTDRTPTRVSARDSAPTLAEADARESLALTVAAQCHFIAVGEEASDFTAGELDRALAVGRDLQQAPLRALVAAPRRCQCRASRLAADYCGNRDQGANDSPTRSGSGERSLDVGVVAGGSIPTATSICSTAQATTATPMPSTFTRSSAL